jgi:hydrogenase expression/formation protein HypE
MNRKNLDAIAGGLACPIPISEYEKILLAHGGGGTLSHQLIQKMFFSQLDNPLLNTGHDGAIFKITGSKMAFSTDSYVVRPIFFPGGDIGELAVNGTVNDLAMCGAKPLYLSLGFIIEEGLPMEDLWKIVQSISQTAKECGVEVVTGDTKVVDRGKGDKIFINTSGVGVVYDGVDVSPQRIQAGDKILLSGKIAEHGIAILSAREEFDFETDVKSDTVPLNGLVESIINICPEIHVMRDPTRGGVSSALNEIAESANLGIYIEEDTIPIADPIKAICEILGLDPLYIANEGKLLAIVPENKAAIVLKTMQEHQYGKDSRIIGEVTSDNPGKVIMKTSIGSHRIVDMLSGEQLPRIC